MRSPSSRRSCSCSGSSSSSWPSSSGSAAAAASPWWLGSDDHAAIRLQAAGLSVWSTDVVLWSFGALLGIAAILVHRLDGLELVPLGVALVLFVASAWRFLGGLSTPTQADVAAVRPLAR